MNARLARVFQEMDGVRHVILSGTAAGDLAFVDIATGALPFADALSQEALKRRFELVVQIEEDGSLRFPDRDQESRFNELSKERSQDPQGAGARPATLRSTNKPAPAPSASADAVPARAPAGADSLIAAIGLLERAQARGAPRMFVHFRSLGRLLDPDVPASDRTKRVFDCVGRLFAVGKGHPGSRVVVTVSDAVRPMAVDLLTAHDQGNTEWQPVDVPLPDAAEIESFLGRLENQHGLRGSVRAAARQLVRRRYALARISEAVRQGIEDDERDLATMLGSEPEPAAMERALSRLDLLIGLRELKQELRSLAREASAMQRAASMDGMAEPPALHMALLGRPGTGKSEVASLLAELLHAAGACRRNHLEKATIADIVGQYNSGEAIASIRRLARSAAGGVLFIDEAYALAENDWGRQAIDVLIDEMETRRGDLAVVLAGYPDRMQALFQANAGLRSRIPRIFRLPDYTPDELCEIFDGRARAAAVAIDADARAGAHRIIRREATRPHSNARDVRNLFERWNGARLAAGAQRLEARHVTDPRMPDWQRAHGLVRDHADRFKGLPEVTRWMEAQIRSSHDALSRGHLPKAPRITFLGPPGTGKTESARCVGEFLKSCGVLKDGRLIETSLKDFSSSLVGGAIERTTQQFRDASECVLFIDEIYMFAQDHAGREVLNQIVALLTDPEHASVSVIVAGYEDRMREVYSANAGLRDRMDATVRFGSPPSEVLAGIALEYLATVHGRTPVDSEREEFHRRLAGHIEARRNLADFAGARTARKLADEIRNRSLTRDDGFLRLDDLPAAPAAPRFAKLRDDFLAEFPRSESLVQPLTQVAARIRMSGTGLARETGATGIRLAGAPGTGKSTFARWIARRMLARTDSAPVPFEERSAQSLQGTHLGQAQANVRELFERAAGGVVFIDEFHALRNDGGQQNMFSAEIARELVAQMTNPRNAGMIVIVAGYAAELDAAMQLDHGLKGRFPELVELPSPSDRELAAIAHDAIAARFGGEGPVTLETAMPLLERYFARIRASQGSGFANCREAHELANRVCMMAMMRCDGELPSELTIDDLLDGVQA